MTEFFPLDDFSLSTDYNGQQKHSTAIRDWITTLPLDDDEAMEATGGWVVERRAIVIYSHRLLISATAIFM